MNINNFLCATIFGSSILLATGCQKQEVSTVMVTQEHLLTSSVVKIESKIPGTVYLTQGPVAGYRLEAPQEVLDALAIQIDLDELEIGIKPNFLKISKDLLKVYVTIPQYQGIKIQGSGDVIALTDLVTEDIDLESKGSGHTSLLGLKAEDVEVSIKGSGQVDIQDLEAANIAVTSSGSGTTNIIDGHVDRLNAAISGSGSLNAPEMSSRAAVIKITGSGMADVYVLESLDVNITGSGDVWYRGLPSVTSNITGSGRLHSR